MVLGNSFQTCKNGKLFPLECQNKKLISILNVLRDFYGTFKDKLVFNSMWKIFPTGKISNKSLALKMSRSVIDNIQLTAVMASF